MILASTFLLYRGIISLNSVSQENAVSIEFKNMIKFNTQYPALALFIIGVFLIYTAKSNSHAPIWITGNMSNVDGYGDAIGCVTRTWPIQAGSNGVVAGTVDPSLYPLKVQITIPGYQRPFTQIITPDQVKSGKIVLDNIGFGKRVFPDPSIPEMPSAPADTPHDLCQMGAF